MRSRIVVAFSFLLLSFSNFAFSKDVFLSIGGSVNNFRTDARILNPSSSKDITLQATFLPAGNVDNSAVQSKTITIPKRSMVVYDDVVASLFNASGLGAVRLTSADDFVATQRIYAQLSAGTTGQFVPGLEMSDALTRGAMIQLKSITGGAFRTNIGFVNPNTSATTVTLYLYDKNNAIIGQPVTVAMQPLGVIVPTNLTLLFPSGANANLSDAWVSFTATQAIFAYASVIDNGTTDPTFIPASEDSGSPSGGGAQTVTVTVGPGLTFNPSSVTIKVGDTVKWVFNGFHTTTSDSQSAAEKWDSGTMSGGMTFSHTFTNSGDWPYYCSLHSVPGGTAMNGVVHVSEPIQPPGY